MCTSSMYSDERSEKKSSNAAVWVECRFLESGKSIESECSDGK